MSDNPARVALLTTALLAAAVYGQGWVGQGRVNGPDTASFGMQPCVASDESGTPWAVWDGDRADTSQLFAKWGGNGWSPERGVGPDGPGVICRLRPSLAFDDRGVAWLVWDNAKEDNTDDIGSSLWADTGWTPEVQVNLPDSTELDFAPQVACGGGQVWCVWYGGPTSGLPYSVYASRWNDDIARWEPEMQASPSDSTYHWWCDLAVDSQGTPHAVWCNSNRRLILYSYYDGSGWVGPTAINDTALVGAASWADPHIVIDHTGMMHVSYTGVARGAAGRDIFYTRNDGSGWTPSVRVTQDTLYNYNEWYSDIAADRPDNVWVVWDRQGEGPDQFRVYAAHYDGRVWSPEDRLDNDSAYQDGSPDVCLDGLGEPWVVWTGSSGQGHLSVYYNRRVGAGMCESPASASSELVLLRCAALARTGLVRITYRVGVRSRVHLAVYDMLGRLVEILVNRTESEGEHVTLWRARVPNGRYFCRLNVGEITETSKIVVTGRR